MGVEVLRGAHPAGAVGQATLPLGVTPYLKPRTSRPLSARTAFYAVAWPLPGASLPQGRHLTLLLSGRDVWSTKRLLWGSAVAFNGFQYRVPSQVFTGSPVERA